MIVVILIAFEPFESSNESEDEKQSARAISTLSTPIFVNSEVSESVKLAPSAMGISSTTSSKDFIIQEPDTTEVPQGRKSLPFKMTPMAIKRQIAHSDEVAPKLMCISNDLTNYHISKNQVICSGGFSWTLHGH